MDKETILRECYAYLDTVVFFYVMSEAFKEHDIEGEIEHAYEAVGGGKRTPDFAIRKAGSNTITDVWDHKGSVSSRENAADIANHVYKQYKQLRGNGSLSRPQVGIFYPKDANSLFKAAKDAMPSDLSRCRFDQGSRDNEIRFNLEGPVRNTKFQKLLEGGPLTFSPSRVRSTYKFIRAGPPPIYTAFELWSIFPTFMSIHDAGQDEFVVHRQSLMERLKTFFPPWIRNNQQLQSSRVKNALVFLDEIEFVDWKPNRPEIIVYIKKGSRSGDLLEYFAERWLRLHQTKRERLDETGGLHQKTLPEFLEGS